MLFETSRRGWESYIWSGLWHAKEALKNGYRWILGYGDKIRVFEDAWLIGNTDFRVSNTNVSRIVVTKV